MVINAFENIIFCVKTIYVVNDNDNNHYTYVDELHPKETLIPRTSATPPIILDPLWGPAQWQGVKVLPPKQVLQRLPILLAQVQAGNTSRNPLNEIREVVYSLHETKQISKKVYNNLLKFTQKDLWCTQALRHNFTDKIDLQRGYKRVALSDPGIYFTWKNMKKSYKNNKSKMWGTTWDEEFELPDGSYAIWDIEDYFKNIIKKHETTSPNIS